LTVGNETLIAKMLAAANSRANVIAIDALSVNPAVRIPESTSSVQPMLWGFGERWRVAATSSAPASLSISIGNHWRKSHGSPICARRRACARRRPKQRPEYGAVRLAQCIRPKTLPKPAEAIARAGGSESKEKGRKNKAKPGLFNNLRLPPLFLRPIPARAAPAEFVASGHKGGCAMVIGGVLTRGSRQ
jgi:hypothetical protein